jgi:hypothetical protein
MSWLYIAGKGLKLHTDCCRRYRAAVCDELFIPQLIKYLPYRIQKHASQAVLSRFTMKRFCIILDLHHIILLTSKSTLLLFSRVSWTLLLLCQPHLTLYGRINVLGRAGNVLWLLRVREVHANLLMDERKWNIHTEANQDNVFLTFLSLRGFHTGKRFLAASYTQAPMLRRKCIYGTL